MSTVEVRADIGSQDDVTLAAGQGAGAWPSWQVPTGAAEEWAALQEAIEAVRTPPCQGDPEAWMVDGTSPQALAAQAEAVEACRGCLAVVECSSYAVAAGERFGVWGGMTPRTRAAVRAKAVGR